ncbi:MAG: hypothetical protein CL947_00920 [Epsilonproteobacteria bacterium]|nr:hypothetical protein [Campylobacterota bacterium]|tara:strand:- start:2788 stop:3672 length:885 start_codon:yes stop_codon:yes gene_type:complete
MKKLLYILLISVTPLLASFKVTGPMGSPFENGLKSDSDLERSVESKNCAITQRVSNQVATAQVVSQAKNRSNNNNVLGSQVVSNNVTPQRQRRYAIDPNFDVDQARTGIKVYKSSVLLTDGKDACSKKSKNQQGITAVDLSHLPRYQPYIDHDLEVEDIFPGIYTKNNNHGQAAAQDGTQNAHHSWVNTPQSWSTVSSQTPCKKEIALRTELRSGNSTGAIQVVQTDNVILKQAKEQHVKQKPVFKLENDDIASCQSLDSLDKTKLPGKAYKGTRSEEHIGRKASFNSLASSES